ncbi:hypothetical protein [Streptomyces fulvorobeus]|uniref:Thioesterase domain-containing protein n=1 Tax=Streptomyces fulvorobeus TaxID=284028 RepID=A0A7J0C7U2_9ACTN|nr:hypothetical protein [Streptomyces fulvorobeus]NYE42224.1 thioesterase domain-containing protein [Streptomyces fulvorobeus]GFM98605.1 hypothetical protein Sfulv_34160 [Streptomyces fulvorobeus]
MRAHGYGSHRSTFFWLHPLGGEVLIAYLPDGNVTVAAVPAPRPDGSRPGTA